MNKEQIRKDILELKEKSHLTQREMKQVVNALSEIFIAYEELEKRLEKYRENSVTFDDASLQELSSRLSMFSTTDEDFDEKKEIFLQKVKELEDEQLAKRDAEKDFDEDVLDLPSQNTLDE